MGPRAAPEAPPANRPAQPFGSIATPATSAPAHRHARPLAPAERAPRSRVSSERTGRRSSQCATCTHVQREGLHGRTSCGKHGEEQVASGVGRSPTLTDNTEQAQEPSLKPAPARRQVQSSSNAVWHSIWQHGAEAGAAPGAVRWRLAAPLPPLVYGGGSAPHWRRPRRPARARDSFHHSASMER